MFAIGPVGFLAPMLLAALVALPVLWLLLRLFDNRPLWLKISGAIVLAMPVSQPRP